MRVGERSALHTARARSPLKLLFPKNHGHGQWVFAATFGGGLVGGDAIDLAIDVEEHATLLVGTQASTKAYKSSRGVRQSTRAKVARGALLAWLPDPVTCFAGSRYAQTCDVALEDGASLVLVDTMTSGRVASSLDGERWRFDGYASRTNVTREGAAWVNDAVALDPKHGDLASRMGTFDVLATVVALGPRAAEVRASLLAMHRLPSRGDELVVSASAVGDDGVLLRAASARVEPWLVALRDGLAPLAEELGDDPFERRGFRRV